jgi:predicted DNA-binding transcriptional regulator AlpA
MSDTVQAPRPFLTVEQLAERYGVSVAAVRDWRRYGTGPVVTKVGGLVRFALDDVLAWEQSRREASA